MVLNVNDLSTKMVISVGIGEFCSMSWVRGVERLAELHNVQAALTERRTDGRRRGRSASRHLQLEIAFNLLCHFFPRLPVLGG